MLILTRKLSNFTCTMGQLTDDNSALSLVTMEGRMPKEGKKYTRFLLPPGDYLMDVELANLKAEGEYFKSYWPIFERIKQFPNAGFYSSTDIVPLGGKIILGTEMTDEFSLSGSDDATIALVRFFQDKDNTQMTLRIVEDRLSMEFHDYSKQDIERQKLIEEEEEHRKSIYSKIFK